MKSVIMCAFIFTLSLCQMYLFNGVSFAEEAKNTGIAIETSDKTTEEKARDSSFKRFSDGLSSGILSLMYTPVKLGVSMAGGIVGGLAYPFSGFNKEVSKTIWNRSLGGSYLITSDMLKGKEDLDLFIEMDDE